MFTMPYNLGDEYYIVGRDNNITVANVEFILIDKIGIHVGYYDQYDTITHNILDVYPDEESAHVAAVKKFEKAIKVIRRK